MTKTEFILELNALISGLPADEVEGRLDFYSEMIDDLMEEGLTEAEAVAKLGNVHDVAEQIIRDTPFSKIVKAKMKQKRKVGAGEILLLILGFPLWFPLLIAAFAVILSLYLSLWAVVISLWAVEISLGASVLGCIAGGAILAGTGKYLSGFALVGAALVVAGLSIFFFFACKYATIGTSLLGKKIVLGIKKSFVKKEAE